MRKHKMKVRNVFAVLVVVLLLVPVQRSYAAHVLLPFAIWGKSNELDKLNMWIGWSNGFFQGRGQKGLELSNCIEDRITDEQAIAMIDKRYKDHPEFWSRPLGGEILNALTIKGGPCEGKSLFPED
jgi:hypothetical protein